MKMTTLLFGIAVFCPSMVLESSEAAAAPPPAPCLLITGPYKDKTTDRDYEYRWHALVTNRCGVAVNHLSFQLQTDERCPGKSPLIRNVDLTGVSILQPNEERTVKRDWAASCRVCDYDQRSGLLIREQYPLGDLYVSAVASGNRVPRNGQASLGLVLGPRSTIKSTILPAKIPGQGCPKVRGLPSR